MRRALRLLPIPFSIALALPAMAADEGKPDNWGLCPIGDAVPVFPGAPPPTTGLTGEQAREKRAQENTNIEGDMLSGTENNPVYDGNVELVRGDQYLKADNFKLDQEAGTYEASGNVRYQDSGMRVIAEKAHGSTDQDTHQIDNLRYQLVSRRGNGGADSIVMQGPKGSLNGATYSTCAPSQRSWELRAPRIDVDTDEGFGTARNATVRIGKVPVLYVPWIKFPVDDRRHTGLLYPAVSSSGRNGFDYRQPIYLNLAPNYDATLTPRYMSKRGFQLGAQFRYLYPGGKGVLDTTYMSNDKLRDRDRGRFAFRGEHNLGGQWQARADLNWITDERYLEDFGNSLYGQAAYSMTSTVGVWGRGRYWDAGVQADYYQLSDYTLTETSLPYHRLPRGFLNWEQPFGRWLVAGVHAEAVRFSHDDARQKDLIDDGFVYNGVVTPYYGGSRIDLMPSVSVPLQGPSWFVTPTMAWRYTGYQLEGGKADELAISQAMTKYGIAAEDVTPAMIAEFRDTSPSRSLPIGTLDAGMYFDRDATVGDKPYLQTLEPRLFYLNAPYRDQDGLPLFDTAPMTFSWGSLFRNNRYSGADRQADANQLTLALTSRLIRQTDGKEKLAVSLGQIRYFDDSRVTVPGEPVIERGKSAWVAEAQYAPSDRWNIAAAYQWDPKFRREDLATIRARYLIGGDGVVNIGYRYRRNTSTGDDLLEQADFSFLYPVTPSWSVVGRYYHSLNDHKLLEALAGVQWDSCCMSVRVLARRYVRNRDGDLNNAVQVEFELKGLGSAGQDTERTLRRAILGYYRDDLYLVPPASIRHQNPETSDPTLP